MADGRVEIKFLTDTKEIETAKKTVSDLGTTIDKALEVKTTSNATSVVEKVGTSADDSASKMTGLSKATEQATESVDNLGDEADRLGNESVGDLPDGIEDIGDKAQKSTGGVGSLVKALGLLKVAGVAINMIRNSLGDAVTRVDTMRNFPRMMQQVGFTTDETEQSIERLSSGIDGLPTALDEVVSTAQQLALTTGDLGQATELTLALNNAFLASGSSSADASRGLQQFSQMLSSGKVDMQSWKTLLETMPLALQTVAANFGYTGASAKNDLYAALQDGTITFDDFSQALIDANEAQGGFAELAKTNSEGMATSWTNIQTAVTRGVANVITALDEMIEDLTGNNIAQHFDNLKIGIGDTFNTITSSIRSATPYVQTGISMFQRMTPVTTSLAAAYATLKIVQTVGGFFEASNKAILAAEVAKKGVTLATKTMTAAEIASTGALSASQLVYGLLTGKIAAATVAKQAFAAASSFLLSPAALAAAAIGLLVAGGVAIFNVFKDATQELRDHKLAMDEIATESEELRTQIENNATAFDDSITDIDANEAALKRVVERIMELSEKEEKSAADKAVLQGYVDELNGSVEGLNLTYDAENDALGLSKEAIYAKIEAMTALGKANAAQDRLTEIYKEQVELQEQISRNLKIIQEQGGVEAELSGSLDGVIEETKLLIEQHGELDGSIKIVEGIYSESMSAMTATVEGETGKQIVAFEELSDKQKEIIETLQSTYESYKDAATDMFGQIETSLYGTTSNGDKYVKSSAEVFAEMTANIEANQAAISTWGDNMGALQDRGKNFEGFDVLLEQLQALGPEGAPYVQALVDASDEELAALSETFANGGEVALEALKEAMGIEDFEIEGLDTLVTDAKTSMAEDVESAGFEEIGQIIVDKIEEGVNGSEEPITISPNLEMVEEFETDIGTDVNEQIRENIESEPINISPNLEPVEDFNLQGEEIGKTVGDAIATGVGSANENISSAGRTGGEGAVTGFAAGGSGSYIAGQMLGTGLNNGLASMHNTVVSTAVAMANAAVQAINDALGVASPAKEGIYSGRMLGLGVGGGMEDEMSYIEATADEMALKAIPNFDRIDVNRALSLPHFETMQTSQNITSTQSLAGLDGLARQMDQLIKKNSNVYIQGEKAGELLSDVTDRTSGRESIYNERWT